VSRARRWTLAGAGLAAAAVLLLPAAADWLVTRDGERIETAGPWRVENRLVVFKRPDGSYASMRLSEVDLEASERLTWELAAKARAPEPPPEPPRRKVVARLTEKELPPVERRQASPSEPDSVRVEGAAASEESRTGPQSGARAEAASEPEPEALQIVSWREVGGPGGTGLEFVGDVRNLTDQTALGISVTVVLLDEAGEEVASADALLTASALPPGRTAGFRASFPGRFHFAGVDFRARGELVLSGGEERPGAEPPP
jgi:hypothetical protein